MRLEGRTALVTGAGRGIGRGCALALAGEGARLALNDRPGGADLAETVAAVRELARDCRAIEADVFAPDERGRLVAAAVEELGGLDILVSNPALNIRRPFLDYSLEDLERVLQAALVSGFHLAQLAARHMAARGGGGKIVFISSVHAPRPYAGSVAYNAAKAGLENMARTIAVELVPHRINVNVIAPGWIDTPGEREAFGDETIEREAAALPWGRMGRPAEIGAAAAFLASRDADYITGATLLVDGGLALRDCLSET